jgi:hypothetical protein
VAGATFLYGSAPASAARGGDRVSADRHLALVPEEPLHFLTAAERVELSLLAELEVRGVSLVAILASLEALMARATDPDERAAFGFLRACIEERPEPAE